MDKIVTEFDRVLAELKTTAPGLFGIHAAFDKILSDLRGHASTPAAVTPVAAPVPAAAPATLNPGVVAGLGAPVVAVPVTVTEPAVTLVGGETKDAPK